MIIKFIVRSEALSSFLPSYAGPCAAAQYSPYLLFIELQNEAGAEVDAFGVTKQALSRYHWHGVAAYEEFQSWMEGTVRRWVAREEAETTAAIEKLGAKVKETVN